MPLAPTTTLLHGAQIPQLGLGTWPLRGADAERAVLSALELGYRLVDTAHAYGNEDAVGRAVAACGLPREELFITTKLNAEWHGEREVRDAFAMSTEQLGVDTLDLLLIHWPNPDLDRYVDAWRGMAGLLDEGLCRAIGVSNFKPAHLQRLLDEVGVVPDVNQIELNPHVTRAASRAFHAEHGIATQSWSPIGKGGELLEEPVVAELAERHGRTPAQVVLRWHVELGLLSVPKSADPERQRGNLEVFDFALEPEEVQRISALDRGEAAATDSDAFGH
jgi:2,5-diketo-D-gluconate reductase A